MFSKEIYINRRAELLRRMSGQGGIAIFPGNADAPANYRGNDYKFRQESTFLYFWGIDQPFYAAVLDLDTGGETIFADDVDIDDIVWMGPQPSVRSIAESVGVGERSGAAAGEVSAPYAGFADYVKKAVAQGRKVHFLPQSRYYNCLLLSSLLNIDAEELSRRLPASKVASEPLARAVIGMRLVKQECEIE